MKEIGIMNQEAIEQIEDVCNAIINKENYLEKMPKCINSINNAVLPIIESSEDMAPKVLQVLEDMMYGMTQNDEVFLLDVLRFGVLPLLDNKE